VRQVPGPCWLFTRIDSTQEHIVSTTTPPQVAGDADYDYGYDNGYRAGLQRARDLIHNGKADDVVLRRAAQIPGSLQADAAHIAEELQQALRTMTATGHPTDLIDAADRAVTRLTKDVPS
jgi:isochorismate synthase EntC